MAEPTPPSAAAVVSGTPTPTLTPATPAVAAAPAKALSWASLAKQNLPPQQPTPVVPKSTPASTRPASAKARPAAGAKSSSATSTTKLSAKANSQRPNGSVPSAKDSDEQPFTTVTTSRSASSRSVDWRRKDDSAGPKPRRTQDKGDKPHRSSEKKAGASKENGKGAPQGKSGKKAEAAPSSTSVKPIREEPTSQPTPPAQENGEVAAVEEVTPKDPQATETAVEKPAEEAEVEAVKPSPAPAPTPAAPPKPPAVNIWKVRASTTTSSAVAPAKSLKGFPTPAAAAAVKKVDASPAPSSPPTSTSSLFTPPSTTAPTVSPPSTAPATSTTPSLADEAWPEPSVAAAVAASTSRPADVEDVVSAAGKSVTSEGALKSKNQKKKWVAIPPAEMQASVDQANAASGKTKKAKRTSEDAAGLSSRTTAKKKSVTDGSGVQVSSSSANGAPAPSKKAKKAAAAAAAAAQANGTAPLHDSRSQHLPSGPLVQHLYPHLENFQPPPSAYNPHLADMPILPISQLSPAEEMMLPHHFDLTAGLPSAGSLSSRDGSNDSEQVEISKDVEMSLLKKGSGRSSLGGRVEGNGMPADIAGMLLKDNEIASLGGLAGHSLPMSSTSMDRSRSAPLSGAIPIRAPPPSGLNVASAVFRPTNTVKSTRGGPSSSRGGLGASSVARGGSNGARPAGPPYAGRPNPFAGPYQQANGAAPLQDGRNPYLSPPPSASTLGGASSPHSAYGSNPKDSHMPRLSPSQAPGSFNQPYPPSGVPFNIQSPPASQISPAGLAGLSLSPGAVTNGSYAPYHAPPPMPMPVTVPTVTLEPLRFYLLGQLEYYFGAHNLVKDFFLRKSMDSLGFVDIPIIAAFNRVKHLTQDVALVREVLLLSKLVEVREQKVRLVGRGWQQWLLPDAPESEFQEDDDLEAIDKDLELAPNGDATQDEEEVKADIKEEAAEEKKTED